MNIIKRCFSTLFFPAKALILGSAFVSWVSIGTLIQSVLQTLHIISSPTIKLTDLRAKVCIVTGSNTGVGLRTATALAKCGATVVFACRSKQRAMEAIQSVKNEIGTKHWANSAKLVFVELDLSSLKSVRIFIDEIKKKFTKLDIVVLNAGLNVGHITENKLDARWQVNYLSHWLLISELFPLLVSADGPNNDGARVVCLSSVCHHFGSIGRFAYHCQGPNSQSLPTRIEQNASVYHDGKLAMNLLACELQKRFDKLNYENGHEKKDDECFKEKGAMHSSSEREPHKTFCHDTSQRRTLFPQAISVNPGAVASDIWRGVPWLIKTFLFDPLMTLTFLNTDEGAATSIAAALNTFPNEKKNGEEEDVHDKLFTEETTRPTIYLSPYYIPSLFGYSFPVPFEIAGPFFGARVAPQTLPKNLLMETEKLCKLSEDTVKLLETK